MGYMRHHAFIVTSWNKELMDEAHKMAVRAFAYGQVSDLIGGDLNNCHSFLIGPDGDSEGGDESKLGDVARNFYKRWIDEQAYDDGSNALCACEVMYGDEEGAYGVEWHSGNTKKEEA